MYIQTQKENSSRLWTPSSQNIKTLVLLHFADETFQTILKEKNSHIEILQKWYHECVDIEETMIDIPNHADPELLAKIVNKNIPKSRKNDFLATYIPGILQCIHIALKLKTLDEEFQAYQSNYEEVDSNYEEKDTNPFCFYKSLPKEPKQKQELQKVNISIPENIKQLSKTLYSPETKKEYEGFNDFDKQFKDDLQQIRFYNDEYNTLNPSFSANCEKLLDENEETTLNKTFVLFNLKLKQTITIDKPSDDELDIIYNHPEYGFLYLFSVPEDDLVYPVVQQQYNKIFFTNIEEVNKQLKRTSKFIEFSQSGKQCSDNLKKEENSVKKFLETSFTLSDNPDQKMKASVLCDIIINSPYCSVNTENLLGFKNRLSKYLSDIGLSKKRMNDGIYYYGIIHNDIINNDQANKNKYSKKFLDFCQPKTKNSTINIFHFL
jgi:hypothetical protein